jgi:phosphoglycolate phosphatase
MNKVLQKRGLSPLTPERYQTIFDFPVIEYYRKLGFDFSAEPFFTISTEFVTEYERRRPECGLRPGALSALRHNRKRGVSQSILSASKQAYLIEAIGQFGIGDMFTAVAGLDNHHAFGKVEIGQRLNSEIDLDREEILLIGDTVHDYEVAKAIGVECYLIPSGHQNQQRLAACGARVIGALSELYG